jgi:hypothetical protein
MPSLPIRVSNGDGSKIRLLRKDELDIQGCKTTSTTRPLFATVSRVLVSMLGHKSIRADYEKREGFSAQHGSCHPSQECNF